MNNQVSKTIFINAGEATLTFTADSTEPRVDQITPNLSNNFIDIVSLDAADGDPAQPTVGTYSIYAQMVLDGPWMALEDGGTINAVDTAGDTMADGVGCRASFVGEPINIKIIADSVDVATHFRATITQVSVT